MIERYQTQEMAGIWSEHNKFRNWVIVEIAVLRAKIKLGFLREDIIIPDGLAQNIVIDLAEIARIEESTGHDMMAFLQHTEAQLPESLRPHWHNKLTTYDVQDTALSLQLVASVQQLRMRLGGLMDALAEKAFKYKRTPMIGRTHAVHAEPITFGVKIAVWFDELKRQEARLEQLEREVAVGKLSGAVGMFTLPPAVQMNVCEQLDLEPIIATQCIGRDIHALYLTTLANIGGTLAKIAVAARLMQQTEVREAEEFVREKQDGSSAMPHKRNPVGFENMTGLARILRGNAVVGFENQEFWHERDISNSAPERIILPDSSHVLDYILKRMTGTMRKWVIFPERMRRNLEITQGLIYSQQVQSMLASKSSLPRHEAHGLVKEVARACWETGAEFRAALLDHPQIGQHITSDELDACFDLEAQLEHVDYIFSSVFGSTGE